MDAEPEGRFSDVPRPRANERPHYHLILRPEPGIDEIKAVRGLLKVALRRFGLRCVSIVAKQGVSQEQGNRG